jgi:hypothetical protein
MERLQDLSTVDAGVVGGNAPRVAGTEQMVKVDASFHDRGTVCRRCRTQEHGWSNQLVTHGTPLRYYRGSLRRRK